MICVTQNISPPPHFMRINPHPSKSTLQPNKEASQTFSSNCPTCTQNRIAMSAVPMGAFAAYKVRDKMNAEKEEKGHGGFSNSQKMTPINQDSPDNPTKYTSKAMMAIWGMYNRYSVHNFKSNISALDKA